MRYPTKIAFALSAVSMTATLFFTQGDTYAQSNEGPGKLYDATTRYCVYQLNGSSTLSSVACYDTQAEADSYLAAVKTFGWKVLFGSDTENSNGTFGQVRFLFNGSANCDASRSYEMPRLADWGLDNGIINVAINGFSGCGRVRVWETLTSGAMTWPATQVRMTVGGI